jgi:hypothetical protein
MPRVVEKFSKALQRVSPSLAVHSRHPRMHARCCLQDDIRKSMHAACNHKRHAPELIWDKRRYSCTL